MIANRRTPNRRNASSGRRRASRNKDRLPGWAWLLLGVAVTLSIVIVIQTLRHHWQREVPATPARNVARRSPLSATVKPVPVPPKKRPRFLFYEMLPSHEVVIPHGEAEKAVRANKKGRPLPPALAAPGAYVVQVGAFRHRSEADRAQARIALLGVEAHTEQVTLNAHDIWYRVRIGPESSLSLAQTIVDRLRAHGVKAILIKEKG